MNTSTTTIIIRHDQHHHRPLRKISSFSMAWIAFLSLGFTITGIVFPRRKGGAFSSSLSSSHHYHHTVAHIHTMGRFWEAGICIHHIIYTTRPP